MFTKQVEIYPAALAAGMPVPPVETLDSEDDVAWSNDEYPHFAQFCFLQLGRPTTGEDHANENARVIASISEVEVRAMSFQDFVDRGVQVSRN